MGAANYQHYGKAEHERTYLMENVSDLEKRNVRRLIMYDNGGVLCPAGIRTQLFSVPFLTPGAETISPYPTVPV